MAIDLKALWDFNNPALSEQRFRTALADASREEELLLLTQIARTHGLRRDFTQARAILATIEPALPAAGTCVQVRYHLELGRTYASATHPPESLTAEDRTTARHHFLRAHELAASARLDGLAVDALHMMVCVDTEPVDQIAWNEQAVV